MSTHTPAPWHATQPNGKGHGWQVGPAWLGRDVHSAQTAADAWLIAAAPAMLAVLLKLRRGDLHQRVRPLFDEAQAAIAKATGVKA